MSLDTTIKYANMQLAGALFMALGEIPELDGPRAEGVRVHYGPHKNEVAAPTDTLAECVEDFRQWCEAVRLESPCEPAFSAAGRPVILASTDEKPVFVWSLHAIPTRPYEAVPA